MFLSVEAKAGGEDREIESEEKKWLSRLLSNRFSSSVSCPKS